MVNVFLFHLSSRIYLTGLRKAVGLLSLLPDYPPRPALYPISVRLDKLLLHASFRFLLAEDTLALR